MIELCKVFVPVFIILTIAAGPRPANASTEKGRQIFEEKCLKCHTIGEGRMVGPDLLGVTGRRDRTWLINWIADPEKVIISGDPVANNLLIFAVLIVLSFGTEDHHKTKIIAK